MAKRLKQMLASCDILVAGTVGLITSTGGSTNAHVRVREVLKGPRGSTRVVVAFSSIGGVRAPRVESGNEYIFVLDSRYGHTGVYGLVDDDPAAIIPLDQRLLRKIRTHVRNK